MSIYIYIFVFGLIILSQTFPFALGFNVRRTDYFTGTVLSGAIICATVAVILLFLSVIEHDLTRGWGTDLHFFYLPYLNDGSIFAQLWVSFAITMHFYFLGFVISSIFRRFGKTGMFTFALVSFLGLSLFSLMSTSFQWWGDIFNFLIRFNAAEMASFLMLLVILYVLASYRMLLRATVS